MSGVASAGDLTRTPPKGNVLKDCRPTCIDTIFGASGTAEDRGKIPNSLEPAYEIRNLIEDRDRVFSDDEDTEFPDFVFDPVGVHVETGQTLLWNNPYALHTVTSFAERYEGVPRRIPEGTPEFTSTVLTDETFWLYGFEEEGVYDIQCLPHGFLGMVMRVVVYDGDGEIPEAEPTGPLRDADMVIAADIYDTEVLAPENIVEQETVAWDDLPQLGYSIEDLG